MGRKSEVLCFTSNSTMSTLVLDQSLHSKKMVTVPFGMVKYLFGTG